ncbi:MAG: hypothetical protein IT328_15090 [Caldilineaceae bacterium]|nr:hypothetical protein [Caldilineaceae bacterium]
MKTTSFDKFAGFCAILAGIAIFLYSLAFVVIARSMPSLGAQLSSLFLLLNGLFITAPLIAIYDRLRETDASFALWALILGMGGAFGAAVHGGYDLANALNVPAGLSPELATLPSQLDPRGLLTFGVSGIAIFVIAWLMGRTKSFPNGLRYLGFLLALLLCWLYVGRLLIVDPTHPLLVAPILITGFVVNPAWYLWLGAILQRGAEVQTQGPRGARLGMPAKG